MKQKRWTSIILVLAAFVSGASVMGQEAFKAEQVITLETTRFLPGGMFEVVFNHRFSDTIADSDLRNLYGLDSFAFAGVGLMYGIKDQWSIGIFRTNNEKNFELWTRYGLNLDENLHLAGRVSLNFNTNEGTNDPTRLGFQVFLGLDLGRLGVAVVPSLVTNPARFESDDDTTLALGLQAGLAVTDSVSLVGEVTPVLSGYKVRDVDGDHHFSWGAGIQIAVGDGGHVFTLLVTNQAGTTLDQYLPGATTSNPRLGFNLIRRF